MRGLVQIWRVACYEWFDALRSRRVLVVLLLYLAVAVFSMNGVISILGKMETELTTTLQLPPSEKTGVVSTVIWKSKPFQRMMKNVAQDNLILEDITGKHPVELIYALFAFFYTPLLVVLVAANRVSEELGSGSVRYLLFRTSRACWTVGKFVGMALMIGCSLVIGAVGAYAIAKIRLWGSGTPDLFLNLLQWSVRAWFFSLAYLGLVMGLSHLTRSPSKSTIFGILAMMACFILSVLATVGKNSNGWLGWLQYLELVLPEGYKMNLWRSSLPPLATSAAALATLGFCYLLAGYAFFKKRDV